MSEESNDYIIGMLVAVIVLVVLIAVFLMYKDIGVEGINEQVCKFSNSLKSEVRGEAASKVVPIRVSSFCKTQTVDIKINDWSKCNETFHDMFLAGDKKRAVKLCTMQQVADYLLACWDMNGNGKWQTGNWVCYNLNIRSPDKEREEKELLSNASEIKQEMEKELRKKLECNGTEQKMLVYKKNCNELVVELRELAYQNLLYNNIIEFYNDRLINGSYDEPSLYACAKNISQVGNLTVNCSQINEIVNEDTIYTNRKNCGLDEAREHFKDICYEVSSYRQSISENSDKMNSLLEEYIENAEVVSTIYYYCVDENANETQAYECVDIGGAYECDIEGELKTIPKDEPEENCDFSELQLKDIILSNISLLSAEVPDLMSISESEFKDFLMKYQASKGVKAVIEKDELRFLGENTKIQQNTLTSVGFCSGKGEIGKGIATRLQCNIATGAEIQINMQREKSPYPGYCKSREIIPGKIGKSLASFCQGRREILYDVL